MHYNYFTINYLTAIKKNLKLNLDSNGNAIFYPDQIFPDDIINLKTELQSIWPESTSAISLIKEKHDSNIQSGLFGIVNELDTALKTGFLLGDRVVLIDYLFERLLLKKSPSDIDIEHLGVLASSLVSTIPLAEIGRIVIIPNPFNWNDETKKLIAEVSKNSVLNPDLISLLNMLSITKLCKLHPYTIAESEEIYSSIINNYIDKVDSIGFDSCQYAYYGILGALLSEKLLYKEEFSALLYIPIKDYYDIISSEKDFYLSYLKEITFEGSLSGENNLERIRTSVLKNIKEKNKRILGSTSNLLSLGSGIGSSTISLISTISVVSAPIIISGGILGFLSPLFGLYKSEKNEQPIINVFCKLLKY